MIKSILFVLFLTFITISISSCNKPIPVRHGNVISISKEPVNKDNLTIHWFGTSNYLISLGDNSIMTDPFISYQGLLHMLSGLPLRSNNEYIKKYYRQVDEPNAIFIGHSHYDHLMDTVPFLELLKLKEEDGCIVPVYGSLTTKNILHGYPRDCMCYNNQSAEIVYWSFNSRIVDTLGDWKSIETIDCDNPGTEINRNIKYKAYVADHANHFEIGPIDIKLFKGHKKDPLDMPPNNAYDYKEGYTYFYMFHLMNDTKKSYKVGLAGAATDIDDYDLKRLEACNNKYEENCLDVLILSVPGWQYKSEYPKGLIEKLKPRYVILSHFDNFFESDRDKRPIKTVRNTKLDEFILKIQDDINSIQDYSRFEKIIIPDVNSTIYVD